MMQSRSVEHALHRMAASNPSGFVPVVMPTDAAAGKVLVFAPQNCSSQAAERANRLVAALEAEGIPVSRSSRLSVQVDAPDKETQARLDQLNVVARGEIPVVLINGMGKANPSAEDAVREFRRSTP